MAYSVNMLTTVADCDSVIMVAQKDKSDLAFRKSSAERQKENYETNSISIDADIAATDAEIAALTPIVASLPPGAARDDNETRLKKLELKKFLLTQKDKNYGSVALLLRENDIARLSAEITETDNFIAAVNTRKAAI
ncbi:MAG: hypothetical protein ACKVOM_03975 [Ferruginibacter sp.]